MKRIAIVIGFGCVLLGAASSTRAADVSVRFTDAGTPVTASLDTRAGTLHVTVPPQYGEAEVSSADGYFGASSSEGTALDFDVGDCGPDGDPSAWSVVLPPIAAAFRSAGQTISSIPFRADLAYDGTPRYSAPLRFESHRATATILDSDGALSWQLANAAVTATWRTAPLRDTRLNCVTYHGQSLESPKRSIGYFRAAATWARQPTSLPCTSAHDTRLRVRPRRCSSTLVAHVLSWELAAIRWSSWAADRAVGHATLLPQHYLGRDDPGRPARMIASRPTSACGASRPAFTRLRVIAPRTIVSITPWGARSRARMALSRLDFTTRLVLPVSCPPQGLLPPDEQASGDRL